MHTLVGRIGAINSGNSEVSIPDATRKIEPKRAGVSGVRAAETNSDVHIRNRTARQPARGHSGINKRRDSGPEWANAPPTLNFC